MNKIKDKNKDPLANLFTELPQEKLSGNFRANMMQLVRQEEVRLKKKNRVWGIIGIILGCICMAGATVYTVIHINWEGYQLPALWWSPDFIRYSYFMFPAIILLFLDYQLRRLYRKKHAKDTD
ncbi:MAG: hypothetical protein LUE98_08510 [Tannerellaceae bacterium]|nr:hypothetical protein [Tannerellaceae bacterium]